MSSTSAAAAASASVRPAVRRIGAPGRRYPPGPYSQVRSSRSCPRASRATSRGESDWRWISARVCSTESCRCAAISARSASRMRSRRSSPRSRTSRTHHGTVITATPTSVASTASSPNCTCPMSQVAEQEHRDPGGDEQRPGDHPQQRRPPARARARARPPAALRLVGLPPHHRGPGDGHAQRADDPAQRRVAQRGGGEPDAQPERGQPERLLALARAAPAARRWPPPAGRRSTAVRRRAPRRR